jgi:hypothetical protein
LFIQKRFAGLGHMNSFYRFPVQFHGLTQTLAIDRPNVCINDASSLNKIGSSIDADFTASIPRLLSPRKSLPLV